MISFQKQIAFMIKVALLTGELTLDIIIIWLKWLELVGILL